jgi:hypothetical protein
MAALTIGLMNQSSTLANDEVARVAAALDIQVKRDLLPIWNVTADVITIPADQPVPRGVSPIIIVDETPGNFAGVHRITETIPWAMVSTKRDWALAASHECIELLIDPSGMTTCSSFGLALVDGALHELEERFDYLLEACDPIEDSDHAYLINGIAVSDFYTPHYFDDTVTAGTRYSFNGALSRPREVGRNGYLSWRDKTTGRYRQLQNFGAYAVVELPDASSVVNARMFVDHHTPTPRTHPELF